MNTSTVPTSGRITVEVQPTEEVAYCDFVLRTLWKENWFDGCRPPERLTYAGAVGQPGHLFLKVTMGGMDGGLFRLQELAPSLWEVHSQLLPNCRGELALQAYGAGARFMFGTMGAQRLQGSAPSWHRHAVLMALRIGFKISGRDESRLSRGGRSTGQTHYELTRSRWLDMEEPQGGPAK